MSRPPSASWRIAVFLFFAMAGIVAHACVALAQDPNHPPQIASEQAVIIWDSAQKIEHFIRQANISTTEANLGFIVPTPQTPELAVADPLIFDLTAADAAPEVVPETVEETPFQEIVRIVQFFQVKSVFTTITSQLAVAAAYPARKSVEVVKDQDVGDYHATVLAADDTDSLARWLKENGYAWAQQDDAWLQPYLKAKWKITAFKLLRSESDQDATGIQSRAIRMTFGTEQPFFPYSEPGDAADAPQSSSGSRSLSVAVLSDQRMAGVLKDGHAWPGQLKYSGAMDLPTSAASIVALAKLDPSKDSPVSPSCLTYFLDASNPRPGTADLYFSLDTNQSSYRETIIDPELPENHVVNWQNPASVVEAVFLMVVIAGLPTAQAVNSRRRAKANKTLPG